MKTAVGENVANKVDEKETGLLAYQLWEQAGRPVGQDQRFWFEAEKQLRARAQAKVTVPIQIPAPRPTEVTATRPEPAQAAPTPPVKLSPGRTKAAEGSKRNNLHRFNPSRPGKN